MFEDIALLLVGSFLLGAVPFGLVVARFHSGMDLRLVGSGNIGATNVARSLGLGWGILTLVLDLAKGLLPVLAGRYLFSELENIRDLLPAAAGLCAVLGHVFSPLLKFKGGKGVATALGAFLGLMPLALLPGAVVFLLVVGLTGYVSAGSMLGSLTVPLAALLLGRPWAYVVLAALVAAVIIYRHRENIGRIRRGEENKWRRAKGSK